jgi:hypothetical protein
MGDRFAFNQLLDQLDTLPVADVGRVLNTLSEFPDRETGEQVIAALRKRELSADDKVHLAGRLILGATYKFEKPTYDGGAVVSVAPHPSFSDFVGILSEWRENTQFDVPNALTMETMAARLRLPGAGDRLHRMATQIVYNHNTRDFENPLNSGIRSAMDELEDLRLCLDLQAVIHLAENTDSNAEIGALGHIGAIGTRDALDYLLKRLKSADDNYSTIFRGIETIAGRLGLKIVETEAGLEVASPAS